jgi:RNA polymerase sigma-70 factor (ECF subfamily)
VEREMPTATAESEILLARAKRGDLEAVETLFRVHSGRVYNLARRICRSPQDAEDIVQETFVEVARSIGRYRGEGPLGAWIHRVAANKALMHLRRDRLLEPQKGAEGLDEDSLPATGQPHLPQRLDLEAALAQLPPAARAVVWLHDVEGYTHEEIAEMTGLTASFSKSKLARAHARLKGLLEPGAAIPPQEKDHAPHN